MHRKIWNLGRLSLCILAFSSFLSPLFAQESVVTLTTNLGELEGTLSVPSVTPVPVVLIIAGSGPTDRNGNQPGLESRAYKQLADSLCARGIATLRYDKRGVGKSDLGLDSPAEIKFGHFVDDAVAWTAYLAKDRRFSRIIVAGHSEGSLIGILAAQRSKQVSAFISIAGAGRPADEILKDQLSNVVEPTRSVIYDIIAKLKKGDTVSNVPPILGTLFRSDVQPFLISWFQYDPRLEIAKLRVPSLIVQGDNDVQVSIRDAGLLASSSSRCGLKVISGMNHVLKKCVVREKKEQIKSCYDVPDEPLHPELVPALAEFIAKKTRKR